VTLALVALLAAALPDAGAAFAPDAGGDAVPRDAGAPDVAAATAPDAGGAAAPAPPLPPPPAPPPAPRPYETVVRAPRAPARAAREDRVAASTVIVPDDSPHAFDDLGDLLEQVPGVTVTRSGGIGDFATVTLRGSNPDEVRIYVDGVPLNLAAGGGIDISTIPIGDVERIEIYRGTTPIGFAESALGGIIAITTRAPGARRVTVRAGAGSFGTMFGDATAAGSAGPLHVYAGAHALAGDNGYPFHDDNGTSADPSDDSNGTRQNNHLAQLDGVLRATLDLPGRRGLGLGLIGIARDQGLPGPVPLVTKRSHFQTTRGIAYLAYDSRDDLGPGGRLHAQLFVAAMRDRFHDPMAEIGAIPALTDDTSISEGASATASRPLASWLRATATAEARRETFQPTNQLDVMPVGVPAERRVAAGGVEADLWWRRADLEIIPSARIEAIRDAVTGRNLLFAQQVAVATPIARVLPVLRFGLSRPLAPGVELKANAGRYARAPSFLELYGDTGPLLGNPTLVAEHGWNGDVGATYRRAAGRLFVDGRSAIFGAEVDDLIEWELSASGQSRVGNVDRARIWGIEQDLVLRAGRHAAVSGQATYLDARNDGDIASRTGRRLPQRPPYRAYLRPELRRLFEAHGVSAGAYAEADFSAGSPYYASNVAVAPPRLVLGAGVTVDVPRAGARVALSAKNLTNEVTWLDLPSYPLPGRSVFLSLMWSDRPGHDRDNDNENDK
jgi:iron complex outermembrane receptor protein